MPNHVINIITVDENYDDETREELGAPVSKVLDKVKSSYGKFDFNKILPMPKALQGTRSPADVVPDEEYAAKVKEAKEHHKKIKEANPSIDYELSLPISQSMSDEYIKKYGANNWYDWSTKNWGTKWNAYEIRVQEYGKIVFQTAWSHPFPIIEELSKMFPKNKFQVAFADEDRGRNLGMYEIQNGKPTKIAEIEDGSDLADLLAEAIWAARPFAPFGDDVVAK